MPTSADATAVDTSVAVAALDAAHAAHQACRAVVRECRPALAGHAAFETYAVLTRMPGALALDGPTAAWLIGQVFPMILALEPSDVPALVAHFGTVGIVGGAVYDGLVGEAARTHNCVLLTRDLRARRTYDLLGVDYEVVDP